MSDPPAHPYSPDCPHCQLREGSAYEAELSRGPLSEGVLMGQQDLPPVGAAPFAVGADKMVADRFRLVSQLASGPSGVVYRAVDLRDDRPAAVKVLQWWNDDLTALRRFRREALIVRRLDHPNIVKMLDFGTSEGICYIALAWAAGEPLNVLLQRTGRIDDAAVLLAIVEQCCDALAAVHQLGVVHRDLKPTNIIVDKYPDDPHVWLLDFGMSKLREDSSAVTSAHAVLGSMGYMAPEQALGYSAEASVRTDVYALGALTYRMLTGKLPFEGPTLEMLSKQIALGAPRPPSAHRALAAQVDAAILEALSKQPEARQASAALFARQLREALTDSH